jgi:hypothetical protein
MERAEAFHCSPPSSDKAMILLNYVRQVLCPPQTAIEGQYLLFLRSAEGIRI